jgi:hypothetical protein
MADTTIQREIENWIRHYWLPSIFKGVFIKKKIRLSSGGVFEFDAVSDDETIAVNISTSSAVTSGGKRGSGKLQKIRADIYFLLLLPDSVKRRLLLFTEPDMVELCQKEQKNGRIPQNIEIIVVELPENLKAKLIDAKKNASSEVSPN